MNHLMAEFDTLFVRFFLLSMLKNNIRIYYTSVCSNSIHIYVYIHIYIYIYIYICIYVYVVYARIDNGHALCIALHAVNFFRILLN